MHRRSIRFALLLLLAALPAAAFDDNNQAWSPLFTVPAAGGAATALPGLD